MSYQPIRSAMRAPRNSLERATHYALQPTTLGVVRWVNAGFSTVQWVNNPGFVVGWA